jgi:hypothetical protein
MRRPLLPPDRRLEFPERTEANDLTLSALFALFRGEPCCVLLNLENIEGGPTFE